MVRKSILAMLVAGVTLITGMVNASDAKQTEVSLPEMLTWTAYGTTATSFAQAVAVGNALKNSYGTTVRIIPGKNDVSRMAPLRDGRADFCACGIAAYFGQEGVFLFAAKEWGPQPLRMVMASVGDYNLAVATAKDANIKTFKDMKGKRVSWVRAGDGLNWNIAANLAFAGLTWDDVRKIEVSGFKASIDSIINGQSDAAFMATVSPEAQRIAASPRGLYWPPLPHDDAEGWARMSAVQPVNQKHVVTTGVNISKDNPHEGAVYPYPVLITNARMSSDTVYALVKGVVAQYESFKDAAPGAKGWALSQQSMETAMPYHEGAIRFWKEKGMWSTAAQKHNDMLIKRQSILTDTWEAIPGKDSMSKEDLSSKWMAARTAALTAAGMELVFN